MIDFIEKQENKMLRVLTDLKKRNMPVVLFGADLCGKNYMSVLKQYEIPVIAFVDDDKKKQKAGYCGKTVLPTEELFTERYAEYPILISSFGPSRLMKRLEDLSKDLLKRVVWTEFYLWEKELDYYEYYQSKEELIHKAYGLLSDEKSRKCFRNLLQYKISRDRSLIREIQDSPRLQYFDPNVITFGEREIFLDLGAYTGDTVNQFCNTVHGKYEKVYAVEPDEENYRRLQVNTKQMKNIACLKCGVASQDGVLRFSSDGTWTSAVDEMGNAEVEVKSVDNIVRETGVTYIKADIEGYEEEMLLGAHETIVRNYPQLAIAVYHKKKDIFTLINSIHELRDDYDYYLRHYTELPIDSVLYAVRKDGS